MSGGFFRGTSAAQDTRFSNKQAKLLKSQKFAPELDQLVDMKKVKMDVIRPWIATRATEFLGFEDEVLINFIYGLLDGKEVDGKQIQIQLTGFMEKNTGKFMKELWSLLLSAQKNASGVPQQFLDAKEEETKKKKAEADRITLELQKKKEREGRELEWEHHKKMDGEMDVSRTTDTVAVAKNSLLRVSEDREVDSRHGSEGNNRLSKSPHAVHRSPSPRRSASRSRSKSFSNSRSYSRSPYSSERRESRSLSGSPQPRRRSPSLGRQHRSPIHSPRRRHSPRYPRSPTRRRSPHIRRRSPSPVRRRSPSPIHHRSPSPVRRRSPSPVRRRSPSPVRCRSPSPVRRRPRTPPRRRSPSPIRRRSPSPLRRRSPPPFRRRSPSPFRRRSPSPFQRRSPSPMRRSPLARSPRYRRRSPMGSPRRRAVDSQVSPRQRKRSRSPYGSHSPYKSRRSLSRERDGRINGLERRRYRDDHASQRSRAKRSPDHHALEREGFERPGGGRKGPESISHQPPISLRSPQRDVKARTDSRIKVSTLSSPPEESPSQSESPPRVRKINPDKVRRKPSPVESPVRPTWERAIRHDSPEIRGKEAEKDPSRENQIRRDDSLKNRLKHSLTDGNRNKSPAKVVVQEYFPLDYSKSRKKDNELRSGGSPRLTDSAERTNQQASYALKEIEYGPGRLEEENFSPSSKRFGRVSFSPDERFSIRQVSLKKSYSREGYEVDEKKQPISSNVKHRVSEHKSDTLQTSMKWMEPNNQVGPLNMDGEEAEIYRSRDTDKRKGKRQESLEVAWNNEAGHASPIDERKEAKRRKKEEKRFRKEERRRRREERHRRREERHAGKLKSKSVATVMPPSDFEKLHSDAEDSEDGDVAIRKTPHPSDTEEAESEQKRLEIELRKKALESLRAKKAISH